MDKNAIKKYAVWARRELIARVAQRAALYEITEGGFGDPDAQTAHGRVLTDEEKAQRQALVARICQESYQQVMEEVAYTWFNRFIALRFMEVNGYLPSRVRVFTDENNQFKPQILAEAMNLELDGLNPQKVYAFKNANDDDGLFKHMIIVQCNALSAILPRMFQRISDYTELLFPDNLLREGSVVEQMISAIPEDDWRDAVQIIGWLYQYYISEKHDEIVNIYKGTVAQKDVPAATQLFTTDWVVRYMVDNSVGRYWIERHPNSPLTDKLQFFVRPKNGVIPSVDESIAPQEVTFLDPCMGSGHILAYAFDVLMEIYKEYGYTEREAAAEIVQHNLHGLDIDERCTQLADFVVMMKARQYDRRFFSRGIRAQVYCPKEDQELVDFGALVQANELGDEPKAPEELTLFNLNHAKQLNDWNYRRILSQKYAVVCTNPPYLNKYNDKLKKFVTENYKDYSGDLFSVFIYRNFGFCKTDGYSAFMTPFVWMFIKTYEKLREYIINNKSITSLIQMEYSAFEEATVPICSFVLQNCKSENKSLCFRLSDFKGGMEVQKEKVLEALQNPNCGYFYEAQQSNFNQISGFPIAYWCSAALLKDFMTGNPLGDLAKPRQGMATTNNNLFLRLWYEVSNKKICCNARDKKDALKSGCKWFPYNKGGEYRKWYGNNDYLVNWENDGADIKRYLVGKNPNIPRGESLYFKPCFSWSLISSAEPSFRYKSQGHIFDIAGMSCFTDDKLNYLLALCNSKIALNILSILAPTINFQAGDISNIPVLLDKDKKTSIEQTVDKNIEISRLDWDSFETSWDFKKHPLV